MSPEQLSHWILADSIPVPDALNTWPLLRPSNLAPRQNSCALAGARSQNIEALISSYFDGVHMITDPIRFVRRYGIVLESAKGPIPNLAEAIAGAPIRGSWWKHPASKRIFRAMRFVRSSDQILVCRLVEGKVTYVHCRLWPALVRLVGCFKKDDIAAIREEHSASGEHRLRKVPFPKWVPLSARQRSKTLTEATAAKQLGSWAESLVTRGGNISRSSEASSTERL